MIPLRWRHALAALVAAGAAAALAAACSSQYLTITDYQQRCVKDADCVAVTVGDVCNTFCCPNAAINVADQAKWLDDRTKIDCSSTFGGQIAVDCATCGVVAFCNAGRCDVRLPDGGK